MTSIKDEFLKSTKLFIEDTKKVGELAAKIAETSELDPKFLRCYIKNASVDEKIWIGE